MDALRPTFSTATGPFETGATIDLTDRVAWDSLDKAPFAFRHRLTNHPLFDLPRLAELSKRVFDRKGLNRYFPAEELKLGRSELERRLRQSILDIGRTTRWLALHFVNELDPAYEELFQALLRDIEEATGTPVRRLMSWGSMTIFMNSPRLSVPYHFDHETNFLMQIRGTKEVWLYPNDRRVLTEEELEDFYRNNPIAGRYREAVEPFGRSYTLTPGMALHHPPLAPHRITNGDEVSVSLSIYYTMPATEERARVWQANFFLRKLGLVPRPPGVSPWVDEAKIRFMKALSKSHPTTHEEALYSGAARLAMPARLIKKLVPRVVPQRSSPAR